MAESEKPKPPESPTTARELDFDDDEIPLSPRFNKQTSSLVKALPQYESVGEATISQPPRTVNPREQAESTLREAFPTMDPAIVKAVLVASGGQVEPAFNALLGMSDPDAQQEALPPAQPPRPVPGSKSPAARSQVEADELYARQLAEHYNGQAGYRVSQGPAMPYGGQTPRSSRPQKRRSPQLSERSEDRERSFIDDDLPVIRDNIRKGFLETQSKVNSFITNLRKKIDGEDEDEDEDEDERPALPARRTQGSGTTQQYGGRQSGSLGRRSGDYARYDADPEVLGDDFATLQMRDETVPSQRSGASRPLVNPDLFKPTPSVPQHHRKVSFQDGPPQDINAKLNMLDPIQRPSSTSSKSKWQPLAAVDPHPITDHDPFSLGDSDDEESKKKDIKTQEKAGGVGTKDKEADDQSTGKS